ncbi:hypothetical protein ACPPVO_50805 [Dactylosporangium sp. McL0621]|uniref:hypothetical protein n=1 Tax=Dactylosporangium sp. McL0621 TaxID=3415678 RepID=UPI003CFAD45B
MRRSAGRSIASTTSVSPGAASRPNAWPGSSTTAPRSSPVTASYRRICPDGPPEDRNTVPSTTTAPPTCSPGRPAGAAHAGCRCFAAVAFRPPVSAWWPERPGSPPSWRQSASAVEP